MGAAMGRGVVWLLVLLALREVSWGQPAGYSPCPALDSLAQALQVRNGQLRSVAADFVEEHHTPLLAAPGRSEGRFYLEVGRGVCFDYQRPARRKLAVYRDSLVVEEGGMREVTKFGGRGRGNPLGQMLELALLRSLGNLRSQYALTLFRGTAEYLLELRPRRAWVAKQIARIAIYLRAGDLAVSRLELLMPGDNTISYEFTNQRFNLPLSAWPQ